MAEVEQNDDLRGDIARAMASSEPIETAPIETPDIEAPEPAETPAEVRARDEAGRFAEKPRETLKLKPAEGAATIPTPNSAAAPKVDIPPPMEWKGEEKLLWKNVPNALKQKYNDDIKAAREQASTHAPLMEAIGRDRDMLIREGGGTMEAGVRRLLDLSNFAIDNPVEFVRTFMQQRGLDPAQIFGQGIPQGQPQSALSPEFQSLQQRLDAFERSQTQQAHSATLAQIETFANAEGHEFFNDVSDDMLAYLKENPALGLQGAYDRAVWGNPATRAQMLAAQSPSNQSNVDAARAAKSARLNGSPVPGASSQTVDSNEDLRASLERNYRASMGGQRV